MEKSERRGRLRLTVSGGLEGLAQEEVKQCLAQNQSSQNIKSDDENKIQISWHQRGNSGSQLEVELPTEELQEVTMKLMACRFVDYVFLQVASIELSIAIFQNNPSDAAVADDIADNNQLLLDEIQRETAQLSFNTIDRSIQIWKDCQRVLLTKQNVGLDSLPGELLPTPAVEEDITKCPTNCNETHQDFLVNTIYTKPNVAKAVTHFFQQLVQRYLLEDSQESRMAANNMGNSILWLDAGAGSASLLNHLPADKSIGIDTHPQHPSVHTMDYLHVTREWLASKIPHEQLCIISNPPFAERSRGDYTAIVKFINQAIALDALFVGLIVPVKFARQRIWQSLGMNPRAQLVARFLLPTNSFYDPSDCSSKHILSVFLMFDLRKEKEQQDALQKIISTDKNTREEQYSRCSTPRITVTAKRDKGTFPDISTKALSGAVVAGLHSLGVDLGPEKDSHITLSAKLNKIKSTGSAHLELHIALNPRQPLALANCISSRIAGHSLGWISISVKPSIAYAMCSLASKDVDYMHCLDIQIPSEHNRDCSLVVNTMCGEGTIELESQHDNLPSFFLISGDKDENAVRETSERLESLSVETGKRPLVDLVIWDAQRLPFRSGFVGAVLSDLPIAGSKRIVHQVPSISNEEKATKLTSLDYNRCMAQAARILAPQGRAVLVSADSKALSRSVGVFNGRWTELWSSKLNIGGLVSKISLQSRLGPRWKDLSLLVEDRGVDLTESVATLAAEACTHYCVNSDLQLTTQTYPAATSLIDRVELQDSYFHEKSGQSSQLYRIWFDETVNNVQAKTLEAAIRNTMHHNLPKGASLR